MCRTVGHRPSRHKLLRMNFGPGTNDVDLDALGESGHLYVWADQYQLESLPALAFSLA